MTTQDLAVPVIAIDGPTASGKGTLRRNVALALGYRQLDSGLLFRATGLVCHRLGIAMEDPAAAAAITWSLTLTIEGDAVMLDGEDVTHEIRTSDVDRFAKTVAKHQMVHDAVREHQLAMRKLPGLVADGRDMGRVFDTPYRFFITCDAEERARRRFAQFLECGASIAYDQVLEEILARDEADRTRSVEPFEKHPDAIEIDTTHLSAEETCALLLSHLPEDVRRA